MAVIPTPASSRGILNAVKGALGLFDTVNKSEGGDNNNPIPIDPYESAMSEVEVLQLVAQWKRTYAPYNTEIEKHQKLAYDYWIGRHRSDEGKTVQQEYRQQVDNLIFEAVETFLPIATRANPEPVVTADSSDIGQKLAKDIQVALASEADRQKLRRKLAKTARHWALNKLGAVKVTWDVPTSAICTDVVSVKDMIFDKDGYVDEGGVFHGEYLGQKRKKEADKLAQMFPKKKDAIVRKARGKMGTFLEFTEWWYEGRDVFYTLDDDTVLGKYKNPNWNYDGEVEAPTEDGGTETQFVKGTNHLKAPSYPFLFLAVFNTGKQPHDDTSLILQNIPIQDRINRRFAQIDDNVKNMNNGLVVSGRSFTEDQASGAAAALRRGVAIRVPDGNVQNGVARFPSNGLPADVFKSLEDDRNELRNIFGTSGSTPQGTEQQKTVRGKILINQLDASRIGGGVTECIEQLADSIYNQWLQMMYVFYDEEHYVSTAGTVSGPELIAIRNTRFPQDQTITVTVKEGSLIPKDPLTQRNEAMDLWSAGAIDPINFYKKLDFPDPQQAAQALITWQLVQKGVLPPNAYLPSFQLPGQAPMQTPGVGGPAVNPLEGPNTGEQGPPPASPAAEAQQSQQLLSQVPIQ